MADSSPRSPPGYACVLDLSWSNSSGKGQRTLYAVPQTVVSKPVMHHTNWSCTLHYSIYWLCSHHKHDLHMPVNRKQQHKSTAADSWSFSDI